MLMNREERIREYEEMNDELYEIQKAIRMVWRQQQVSQIDECLKEELK
jgi:hypothetical protein